MSSHPTAQASAEDKRQGTACVYLLSDVLALAASYTFVPASPLHKRGTQKAKTQHLSPPLSYVPSVQNLTYLSDIVRDWHQECDLLSSTQQ